MEHPSLNRNQRPAPPQTFIEGLKGIPADTDWKSRLRSIPNEAYLDAEIRPLASAALKDRLKRIPTHRKVIPMIWQVAAAVAGLGLLSLLWWPEEPTSGFISKPQVERLTPTSPRPLPNGVPAPPALQAMSVRLEDLPQVSRNAPLTEVSNEPLTEHSELHLKPLAALSATPLEVLSWDVELTQDEEPATRDDASAQRKLPPSLRARFARTGEQLLARSGGKWGWSLAPENDAVKFRVYANKNQWIALRREGPR